METRRWTNPTQPQTLQIAVFLLYIEAVFGVLFGQAFFLFPLGLLLVVGQAASGFGIANERKWGYFLGIGIAVFFLLPFALSLLHNGNFGGNAIGLLFAVAKFALLVHPQSRSYQRIWFK